MYVKRNYGFWMTFNWSKQPFIIGAAYTAIIFVMNVYFEMTISLPWQPISVIGIAVAFTWGLKTIVPTTGHGKPGKYGVLLLIIAEPLLLPLFHF